MTSCNDILNFQASAERIARLVEERAIQNLAKSKKRDPLQKAEEEQESRQYQPPRPLDEINADISGLQLEIVAMLCEVIQ